MPPVQSAVTGAVTVAAEVGGPLPTCPPHNPLEFPLITKPPLLPVVFSTMPFVAPLAEMLRNSKLLEPIVVLATFSAVPVVVVRLFTNAPVAPGLQGFSSHTFTVPPPVAVKAGLALVFKVNPPAKVMVAPVLEVKLTPVAEALLLVIVPLKVLEPPVELATETMRPVVSVMVPSYVTFTVPVSILKSVPVALEMELPAPAEKVPLTSCNETPVVELLVLVSVANGKLAFICCKLVAGPPVAESVATPAPTLTRVPVVPV